MGRSPPERQNQQHSELLLDDVAEWQKLRGEVDVEE